MTNQEAKQKAIQEAYGEYWEQLLQKAKVTAFNNDSWVYEPFLTSEMIALFETEENMYYRPKSLSGIEDNNGFIRIEPDGSNLPTDETKRYISGKLENGVFKECISPLELGELSEYHTSMQVTHYRPVEEMPNPIY